MSRISEEQLGTENITHLMIRMSIPSIVAQTINILYSIIDRIYIGHIEGIGTNALTGVGLTLPIITLISAFSAFVGAGGAPLASIFLGKGEYELQNRKNIGFGKLRELPGDRPGESVVFVGVYP